MKKLLLILLLSSCSQKYVMNYRTPCRLDFSAFYFINKEGRELTLVDSCGKYDMGMKTTEQWIIKQSKLDFEK